MERIERAESVILDLVHQLENAKTDTILDFGLAKFSHREKFRQFALENNFQLKLHYLNLATETSWNRVQQRNLKKDDTFQFEVSKADLDFMES